ncbi:MAG: maleylpyruvate isomerase N-terminal domain-containing protein [Nocardiopsaceae bacterium]|nr:maleylpyruvate isomerase N-terminal domain-containing protein [Nocardiopsaceae bacterium]
MTEIHEQLAVAAREAGRLARGVDPAQLADPTPCPDYDVRALTTHLMQEIVLHSWDLAMATGQTPNFPDEIAATVARRLDQERDADATSDWYIKPIRTASNTPLDRAVAKSGRDPRWRLRNGCS